MCAKRCMCCACTHARLCCCVHHWLHEPVSPDYTQQPFLSSAFFTFFLLFRPSRRPPAPLLPRFLSAGRFRSGRFPAAGNFARTPTPQTPDSSPSEK